MMLDLINQPAHFQQWLLGEFLSVTPRTGYCAAGTAVSAGRNFTCLKARRGIRYRLGGLRGIAYRI